MHFLVKSIVSSDHCGIIKSVPIFDGTFKDTLCNYTATVGGFSSGWPRKAFLDKHYSNNTWLYSRNSPCHMGGCKKQIRRKKDIPVISGLQPPDSYPGEIEGGGHRLGFQRFIFLVLLPQRSIMLSGCFHLFVKFRKELPAGRVARMLLR